MLDHIRAKTLSIVEYTQLEIDSGGRHKLFYGKAIAKVGTIRVHGSILKKRIHLLEADAPKEPQFPLSALFSTLSSLFLRGLGMERPV